MAHYLAFVGVVNGHGIDRLSTSCSETREGYSGSNPRSNYVGNYGVTHGVTTWVNTECGVFLRFWTVNLKYTRLQCIEYQRFYKHSTT